MKKLILTSLQLILSIIGFLSPKSAASLANYFFSRPKRRKNRDWMEAFLDTSVNDYLQVEKHRIKSYLWKGDNRGVLFLHGWRSNAARWKYLISRLQDLNVDLITVDAPGHGESEYPEFNPPNYAKVIQVLVEKYNPRIIVAHSVGAYTALFHLQKYKPVDIKYVLLAPTFDMMLPINEMFRILKLSKKTQDAYVDIIEKGIDKKMTEIRADKLISKQDPEGILLHDINDKILPFDDSVKLSQKSKHLKFHKIDSNGHRMQNDQTEEIVMKYIRAEITAATS